LRISITRPTVAYRIQSVELESRPPALRGGGAQLEGLGLLPPGDLQGLAEELAPPAAGMAEGLQAAAT
jgi:hypothetical protein